MLDSTARAERIDLTAHETACYTWEAAQKPVAVRLPLALIDRLESEAVETFRSLTSRGSEIGGLLLGLHTPGNPTVVTVSDFELISCDYSRGALYRLAAGDIARFEQAMEKYAGAGGAHVVGYFRSHTRKGLSLDAEDLAFFEPRFLEPHQVVLLIRPFATKVSTGGIFIRENGRLSGESSYREFPFRSSELSQAGDNGEKRATPAASTPAPPAAPPVLAPKPQSRAQIVPIASRREIALPEPVVSSPLVPPVVAGRVDAPPPPPAKPLPAMPVVEKDESVREQEKAQEKTEEKPVEKAVAAPVKSFEPPAEVAPALPAAEIVLPAPTRKNKKLRLVVAAAIGMLVLGGGGLIVYPTLVRRAAPPHAAAPQDSSPLSLRVERTSGGMLLTWNRDLPVIQSASKVVLAITDGDRRENIQLDPNQVRTGSILYPPITGDVSFQMEVTDPHQTKTTSESLRVLDPRPSPLDQPAAVTSDPAGAKDTTAAKPSPDATSASAPPAPGDEVKAPEDTPPAHPAANLKPFNSATLAQRLRPVSPTDLPEAPPVVRASPSDSSAALTGIVGSQTTVPAPPKPVVPPPAPAPRIGGQLIPARVVARIDPEYPKIARQAGASGVVELEATISVDGRVKNPHVVHGNSMLQKAAIDAVLQWRYQPAMLDGKAVESPVEIRLNFVAQAR